MAYKRQRQAEYSSRSEKGHRHSEAVTDSRSHVASQEIELKSAVPFKTKNVTKEILRNVQETVRKRQNRKETLRYQGDTETCFYFTNRSNNHAPHAFCHIA